MNRYLVTYRLDIEPEDVRAMTVEADFIEGALEAAGRKLAQSPAAMAIEVVGVQLLERVES